MKTKILLYWLSLTLIILTGIHVASGQIMYADFENHAVGNINGSANWSQFIPTSATLDAVVTNEMAYRGDRALELPELHTFYTQSLTVAHNFSYSNSPSHSGIIRLSFMLYLEHTNHDVRLELAQGFDKQLAIATVPSTGRLKIGVVGTSAQVITGRYAQVTVYHDMISNCTALDYDHKRVANWQYCGGSCTQRFNWLWISRRETNNPGHVLIDNIEIESFPADTWAWWRFEEGTNTTTIEHMGKIPPQSLTNNFSGEWVSTSIDPVYSGQCDLLNEYGRSGYAAEIVKPYTNTPVMNDWTLEAIMRLETSILETPTIIHWGDWQGGDFFKGARLSLTLGAARPRIELRDSQEPLSNTYEYFIPTNKIPLDGQWHHVAAVKQAGSLQFYIDGEATTTNYTLGSISSGSYTFETNTSIYIGRIFSGNEAARPEQALDELRFSTRALDPSEFLQFPDPIWLDIPDNPNATPITMTTRCITGQQYTVQMTTQLKGTQTWFSREVFTATSVVHSVEVTPPTEDLLSIRLSRWANRPQL